MNEKFKNFFGWFKQQTVSRKKSVERSPRRDWFTVLVGFFVGLCVSALGAWYVGMTASHASISDTTQTNTSVVTLNKQAFDTIQNYFNTKAKSLDDLQGGGAGIPTDLSL